MLKHRNDLHKLLNEQKPAIKKLHHSLSQSGLIFDVGIAGGALRDAYLGGIDKVCEDVDWFVVPHGYRPEHPQLKHCSVNTANLKQSIDQSFDPHAIKVHIRTGYTQTARKSKSIDFVAHVKDFDSWNEYDIVAVNGDCVKDLSDYIHNHFIANISKIYAIYNSITDRMELQVTQDFLQDVQNQQITLTNFNPYNGDVTGHLFGDYVPKLLDKSQLKDFSIVLDQKVY